jgi:parallel beta-helix repeat protein
VEESRPDTEGRMMIQKVAFALCAATAFFVNFQPSSVQAIEVHVSQYGAVGDGLNNDGDAIRAALKAAPDDSMVVFEKGKTYLVRHVLRVERRGVKLVGNGATIRFVVTEEEVRGPKGSAHTSIQLAAPYTGIRGFTITSNLPKRMTGHPNHHGIVLSSEHQDVRDNRVENVLGGIFTRGAKDFLILNNTVSRTLADGIHVTTGSWGGRIIGNTVRETGDDMIAVVGYGDGPPNIGNVLIEDNTVSGQYWGRGIVVAGAKDVTVRRNKIYDTTHGAGILIVAETYHNTKNVENILVESNEIRNVQTTMPAYNPLGTHRRTSQAAIHVYAPKSRSVRDVLIRGNSVEKAWKNGITIWGDSCQIGLQDNRLGAIGGKPIQISVTNPDTCVVSCADNTLDGQGITSPDCNGSPPNVSGARVSRGM